MNKSDGGPACPDPNWDDDMGQLGERGHSGMSLRDYFAAHALTGIINTCNNQAVLSRFETLVGLKPESGDSGKDWMARLAYQCADAMLAERAR